MNSTAYIELLCPVVAAVERLHERLEAHELEAVDVERRLRRILAEAGRSADAVGLREQLRGDVWRRVCSLRWPSEEVFRIAARLGRTGPAHVKKSNGRVGQQRLVETIRRAVLHSQAHIRRPSVVPEDLATVYALLELVAAVARSIDTVREEEGFLESEIAAHNAEFPAAAVTGLADFSSRTKETFAETQG